MKPKNNNSMDGFVSRRSIGGRGDTPAESGLRPSFENSNLSHANEERDLKGSSLAPQNDGGLTRSSLDESLGQITTDDEHAKRKRRSFRDKRTLIKRAIIALIAVLVIGGIILGVKFLIASGNIFNGNVLGLIQSAPLKTDAYGRSNVLVFGTSEDSRAHNEQGSGALLTDSMMVVSVDQEKNNAFMISIPRDLWVDYGMACSAGYQGRINAVYQCYSDFGKNEQAGREALMKKVGEVIGTDIQYYAQVNYSVVEDAVDAVGGVSVNIESDNPRGIYDPNFDWQCNFQCNLVKYPNGPTPNLDGERALALARARNASGGYGLGGGNFDREQYQQKILKAIREKAVSAGTLTNFGKVSNLIDAFGKNLRTNVDTSEIRTVMKLGNEIPSDDIVSINLTDAEPAVVATGNVGGQSIVQSTSGLTDYTAIQTYIRQQISADPAVREQATIGVYNGGGETGAAQIAADKLTLDGYRVSDVGNAPTEISGYAVYDLSNNSKPATAEKLAARYGVTVKTTSPPIVTTGLDFVIIVGETTTTAPAN